MDTVFRLLLTSLDGDRTFFDWVTIPVPKPVQTMSFLRGDEENIHKLQELRFLFGDGSTSQNDLLCKYMVMWKELTDTHTPDVFTSDKNGQPTGPRWSLVTGEDDQLVVACTLFENVMMALRDGLLHLCKNGTALFEQLGSEMLLGSGSGRRHRLGESCILRDEFACAHAAFKYAATTVKRWKNLEASGLSETTADLNVDFISSLIVLSEMLYHVAALRSEKSTLTNLEYAHAMHSLVLLSKNAAVERVKTLCVPLYDTVNIVACALQVDACVSAAAAMFGECEYQQAVDLQEKAVHLITRLLEIPPDAETETLEQLKFVRDNIASVTTKESRERADEKRIDIYATFFSDSRDRITLPEPAQNWCLVL